MASSGPDYEKKEASDVQKSLTRHQLSAASVVQKSLTRHQLSEASVVQTAFTRQQLSLNSLHTECPHTTTVVCNSGIVAAVIVAVKIATGHHKN